MNDYKIWVSYHKDEQPSKYGLKEDEHHKLFATHREVDGKNINHMNPVYSEMVTMWYAWKNNVNKGSFIGFNHYRRRFDVHRLPSKGECQVYRILDFGSQTVYEQYAQCHNAKDMDAVLSILDSKFGIGNEYGNHIRTSTKLIANCCFLMRWPDFNRMCKFLFGVLEEFSQNAVSNPEELSSWQEKAYNDFGGERTDYQTRVLSFLAERLISAWIWNNLSPYIDGMNVAIVHYNTPELTEAAIRSLMKHTPGCHVYVFDNSDEHPFKSKMPNVEVIDNTKGQLIDFGKSLDDYPEKWERDVQKSNYGSAKHSMSVEYLMDIIPDGFLLMDSDVLVKEDVKPFWNRNVSCVGAEEVKADVPRLMPFLCWLNVSMLRENGIHYFNGDKMWALSNREPDCHYDTGAWLLEEVRRNGLPVDYTNIWKYIVHLGHGSWKDKDYTKWLEENEELWK